MRYTSGVIAAMLVMMGMSASAASLASPAPDMVGYWLVKKKDVVVQVQPCRAGSRVLCGTIAWLSPDAKQQRDSLNPDKTKRTRPLCGVRVMWDMVEDVHAPGEYTGRIYKANDGKTYDATIKRSHDGRLELRGYIGIPLIGKTSFLTPVNKKSYRMCRPVS